MSSHSGREPRATWQAEQTGPGDELGSALGGSSGAGRQFRGNRLNASRVRVLENKTGDVSGYSTLCRYIVSIVHRAEPSQTYFAR